MRACRSIKGYVLVSAAALVLVVALMGVVAPLASAAPTEPTLDVAQLQALLDASPTGTVDGYLKTVLGGGTIASQAPVDIPLTVLSIVPTEPNVGFNVGSLILFEATGPIIDKIGSVADGMSGSPLYVDDGSGDKLIGALSYGPEFTKGGVCLATPIESMMSVESNYPVIPTGQTRATGQTLALPKPVTSAHGVIKRVYLARNAAAARRADVAAGTAVVAPLAAFELGGLPSSYTAYQHFAKRLEARGFTVVDASPLAAGSLPDFETPFTGGASVGDLLMYGDAWAGGLGTVTYAHDDVVVAMGHPLYQFGDCRLYLANAWVSGIFGSYAAPLKEMSPGKIRGTITQDRTFGIAGTTTVVPQDVPITSQATYEPTGRTAVATSYVPGWVADRQDMQGYASYAASVPIYEITEMLEMPGSMTTTATVVVNDGTRDYTVTHADLWDDPYDVLWPPTSQLDDITTTLTRNDNGTAPADIKSLSFTASISPQRKSATIVDIRVPGGLKTGDNAVLTTLRIYSQKDLQTVATTLTIPVGTSLHGTLTALPSRFMSDAIGDGTDQTTPAAPETVAQIVDDLNAMPTNNDLEIVYSPPGAQVPSTGDYGPGYLTGYLGAAAASGQLASAPAEPQPIEVSNRLADRVVYGSVQKRAADMTLAAVPQVVRYRHAVILRGMIDRVTDNTTVDIYSRVVGTTTARLIAAHVPATWDPRVDAVTFHKVVRGLTRNTVFTAVWGGDSRFIDTRVSRLVRVRR